MNKVSRGLNLKRHGYSFALLFLVILYIYSNFLIFKNDVMGLNIKGLPISDSEGWSSCIRSLAIYGALPSDQSVWCNRRPTYVFVGSLIWRVVGSDHRFFLAMNFIFFILLYGILFTLRKLSNHFFVKFLFFATSTFFIWRLLGMTQFMSEQLGILFMMSSVLFFLKYLANHHFINLLLCSFFVLQAELVRPGNVAIISLPIIFYVLSERRMIRIHKLAMLALVPIGTILTLKTFGKVLQYQDFMTNDYSWYGLYGLVHGNKDWTFVFSRYSNQGLSDTQIGQIARDQTISKFIDDPLSVLGYILTNIQHFIFAWAPSALQISSSAWSFVLLGTFALAIKGLLGFRSLNYTEKSLTICAYFAVFAFIAFLGISTIDTFRTLSNSFVLFAFAIIQIVSPLKLIVSTKNSTLEKTSYNLQTGATLVVCCSLMPLVMLIAHFGPSLTLKTQEKAPCVGANEFRFLAQGLQIFSLTQLPKEAQSRWWWKSYQDLDKKSQIYRGFFSSDGQTLSYRSVLVLPKEKEFLEGCIATETPIDESLRNLSLSILRKN
jgi:hypothetical protein